MIKVEERGAVRWIVLDRPDRLNAMTEEMFTTLAAALTEASADERVRTVVVTGRGRAFCVGGDHAILETGASDAEAALEHQRSATLMREMAKPTVVAVNGVTAGAGVSLALSADIRIAAASARFTAGFGAIGLSGDFGGSWTLPRLVGPERALRFYLLNETWNADDALAYGMVGQVVPDDRFEEEVSALAERLAAGAPLAQRRIKANFRAAETASFGEIVRLEVQGMIELIGTGDFQEGLEAFRSRRPPEFAGR